MPGKSVFLALSLIIIIILACGGLTVEKLHSRGMVATSSPIASRVGLDVLKQGGNAVDAAVAIGFALAVCYPEAGNLGGGGFALVYTADTGRVRALDFREKAPARATRDMFIDREGQPIADKSLVGAAAAGVPGTVAGLYELWARFGRLEWYRLVQPAYMLADTGFIVGEDLAGSLAAYRERLRIFPETEAVFFPGGSLPAAGERFIQKELAATIERISLDSLDGFYSGRTADLMVACMERHGGLIGSDDLKNYRPLWREPVSFSFDSLDIYSMSPPSSGGVILGIILKLLEPFDIGSLGPQSPEYIHSFAEACRLAYAERAVHLGDPDFVDNPVTEVLAENYLEARRKLIDPEKAGMSTEIESGVPYIRHESESTTHFCVCDSAGNAVSLTYTINTAYGSKLVVDSAGFLLNNEMDDFSASPGSPNVYGLIGGEANAVVPGKRMLSSMSPTIVLKKGKPFLVLGSPGGSKIITTVAQALIDFSRFGLNPSQVVAQPRFHHQWLPDTLYLETGGFDINIKQALIARGHMIKERSPFGDLQLIYIDDSGMMTGAADPRRAGQALGY